MGSQRVAHVPPERCRRVFNLLDELVGVGDGLPEMEAGKIRVLWQRRRSFPGSLSVGFVQNRGEFEGSFVTFVR